MGGAREEEVRYALGPTPPTFVEHLLKINQALFEKRIWSLFEIFLEKLTGLLRF